MGTSKSIILLRVRKLWRIPSVFHTGMETLCTVLTATATICHKDFSTIAMIALGSVFPLEISTYNS